MDFSQSTTVVCNRIQKLEPENVAEIFGYLLQQNYGEREMIRLAFGPDNLIQSIVNKAKIHLGLSSNIAFPAPVFCSLLNPKPVSNLPLPFVTSSPPFSRISSSPVTIPTANTSNWDPRMAVHQQPVHNMELVPVTCVDSIIDDSQLQNQLQFLSLEDQLYQLNSSGYDVSGGKYYYPEPVRGPRASCRSPSLPEFPLKVCHYFNRGFCKHGSNCRYFHGHFIPESFSQSFKLSPTEIANEDHIMSPASLEKLETELGELLRARRGAPVSIASLPNLYYEKYGRTLQAEGYLTESQRHGKAGYSLTKLLARMRNSIHLIERPHGQHSVILAEDIPKYMDFNLETNDNAGTLAGSHQIYLTFPADSTFSELDVCNYFQKFGPVQDVRIPSQQKRMFGFVTFVYAETVKQILAKENPHSVCGSRVLVKPYREKSKLNDRKHVGKLHHPVYLSGLFGSERNFHSLARVCDNPRLLWKQLRSGREVREQQFLSDLQSASKSFNQHSYVYELKPSEDHVELSTYNHLADNLNCSDCEGKVRPIKSAHSDKDGSQGLNLPDSPFASPLKNGVEILE